VLALIANIAPLDLNPEQGWQEDFDDSQKTTCSPSGPPSSLYHTSNEKADRPLQCQLLHLAFGRVAKQGALLKHNLPWVQVRITCSKRFRCAVSSGGADRTA